MLSEIEARIKAKIEAAGTPLSEWDVQINYGIKTGFNTAFIIDEATKDAILKASPESAEIIRPILRGEDIKRFYSSNVKWLINSHNGNPRKGIKPVDVREHYKRVFAHLKAHEIQLAKRQDKGVHWSNLRNCAYQDEFSKPKVVWGNLNAEPNFTIDYSGMFIASPSVMLVSADNSAEYFLSVLNSPVCKFYVSQLSYERDNGYIEYQKQFVEQLPIPQGGTFIREQLEELTKRIISLKVEMASTCNLEKEVEKLVFDLYDFDSEERACISQHYGVLG